MEPGGRIRVAATAIVVAVLTALTAAASASAAERPSFGAAGALQPRFSWDAHDYALRSCDAADAALQVHGAKGWITAAGDQDLRGGNHTEAIEASPGEAVTVSFKKRGHKQVRRYHLRCLPDDFPGYDFERERSGGPNLFSLQLGNHFGAIVDRNGAPVWWVKADGEPDNISVLADGTMTWVPVGEIAAQVGDIEVRTIRNRLLHRFPGAAGTVADIHDLLLLPNGNYMIGAQFTYRDDASSFGGSTDSRITGIEIQEFTPQGKEVWNWSSRGNIELEETGRWWDLLFLDNEPYDVVHWNAVEKDGRHILISMRHTDAIYKIDRRSGEIVWKLGGTPTSESLDILGDPLGDYPLGGQHDVRVEPDGTVTIFDNRTALSEPPRAVRYKINEAKGTARLVEVIEDPDVTESICCGSARLLDDGDWLVAWGGNAEAGNAAYDESGRLIFRLTLDVGFTYRAIPVPKGAVERKQLRRAMDAMAQ